MRILVIEDDRNISFVLKHFFSGQGHEVICCFSLEEAYQYNPNRQDLLFSISIFRMEMALNIWFMPIRENGYLPDHNSERSGK